MSGAPPNLLVLYKEPFAPKTAFDRITEILDYVTRVIYGESFDERLRKYGFEIGRKFNESLLGSLGPIFKKVLGSRLLCASKSLAASTQDPIDFSINPAKAEPPVVFYSTIFDTYVGLCEARTSFSPNLGVRFGKWESEEKKVLAKRLLELRNRR